MCVSGRALKRYRVKLLFNPPSDVVQSSYNAITMYKTADTMYMIGALLFLWATLADFGYKRCGDDPSVLLPALLSPRKGGYDLCGCRNRAGACCRRRCRLCRSRRRNNLK